MVRGQNDHSAAKIPTPSFFANFSPCTGPSQLKLRASQRALILKLISTLPKGLLIASSSILEQEFQRRAITSILLGVLASEFNAEFKIITFFLGNIMIFLAKKPKGGPLRLKIFQ